MDWGLVLLGGGFSLLWVVLRAVLRWVEVRAHLQAWGPGAPRLEARSAADRAVYVANVAPELGGLPGTVRP